MSTASVISVVDDHASVRASMSNFLRSVSYVVHTFGSAEEFLGSACLGDTSSVISDLQMSPMNGLELLAKMRMRGYAAPFIFITAFFDESVRAGAMKAGATGFFAKPVAMPEPDRMSGCRAAIGLSGLTELLRGAAIYRTAPPRSQQHRSAWWRGLYRLEPRSQRV